jgi:hypothetical protein
VEEQTLNTAPGEVEVIQIKQMRRYINQEVNRKYTMKISKPYA